VDRATVDRGVGMADVPDLRRVLSPERVLVLECSTKQEALDALIDCLAGCAEVRDREALARGIWHRESLMSTGIGMGIAVPHVRLDCVDRPVMAVGICRQPITDYASLDDEPVRLIFMIAAGKDQHAEYLRLLARVSGKVKEPAIRQGLIEAGDAEAAYRMLVANGV